MQADLDHDNNHHILEKLYDFKFGWRRLKSKYVQSGSMLTAYKYDLCEKYTYTHIVAHTVFIVY